MSLIVWTIQAVNYFDFVTKDGHGLKVYLIYSLLNLPKIIHRILPFVYFISLFYIIIAYENRDELSIFWRNGISKISFVKFLLTLSIFLTFFQILLGAYISPSSQLQSRNYLKNSNMDFFVNLINEGKFVNAVKDLTIFINEKNSDGSFSQIFLDDSTKNNPKMIYSKKGYIINNEKNKIFVLLDGKVINFENGKVKSFSFERTNFNLKNFETNTIIVPKIQETKSINLLGCYLDFFSKNTYFDCNPKLSKEIQQELIKRFYKPIFIPVITLFCCFLLVQSKYSTNYNKSNRQIFFITFLLILFSEAALRYSSSSFINLYLYLLAPIAIFAFALKSFNHKVKNV